MFDPIYASAGETALAIREGRISAVETLEAYLDRVRERNDAIHAIVTLDEEGARARARAADAALARGEVWGTLHGVPITIFDHIETAGIRTTEGGNPKFANHIPARDAVVVARLRNAGAVIYGKSNDDHGFWGEDALFPPPNNPWKLDRTLSGSGGPVGAVAAGLTPIDLGGDAGSTQGPSSFAGVYALRPTEYRLPFADIFFANPLHAFRTLAYIAPVARCVADLRLALEVMAGPDESDTGTAPVPLDAFTAPRLSELRIAWTSRLPNSIIDDEIAAGIEALAARLRSAGAHLEQCHPPLDYSAFMQIFDDLFDLTDGALDEIRHGTQGPSLAAYFDALQRQDEAKRTWERFLSGYDAMLLPVVAIVAPVRGVVGRTINGVELTSEEARLSRLPSRIAPVTGLPTVVMPLGRNHEGLPFGAQLLGHRWKDMRLLAIAEQVAAHTEGFVRPPGY